MRHEYSVFVRSENMYNPVGGYCDDFMQRKHPQPLSDQGNSSAVLQWFHRGTSVEGTRVFLWKV